MSQAELGGSAVPDAEPQTFAEETDAAAAAEPPASIEAAPEEAAVEAQESFDKSELPEKPETLPPTIVDEPESSSEHPESTPAIAEVTERPQTAAAKASSDEVSTYMKQAASMARPQTATPSDHARQAPSSGSIADLRERLQQAGADLQLKAEDLKVEELRTATSGETPLTVEALDTGKAAVFLASYVDSSFLALAEGHSLANITPEGVSRCLNRPARFVQAFKRFTQSVDAGKVPDSAVKQIAKHMEQPSLSAESLQAAGAPPVLISLGHWIRVAVTYATLRSAIAQRVRRSSDVSAGTPKGPMRGTATVSARARSPGMSNTFGGSSARFPTMGRTSPASIRSGAPIRSPTAGPSPKTSPTASPAAPKTPGGVTSPSMSRLTNRSPLAGNGVF